MTAEPATASKLLSTVDPLAQLQWSNLLELQVAQFFPYELQYLLKSKSWRDARRVLDAGCGNGAFLSRLKRYFPDKSYTGLDLQPEYLAAASGSEHLKGIEFVCQDFFAFEPGRPFDVVIMRLIVQHMTGTERIFAKLAALLNPGGSALIIEPDTTAFLNYPPTPKFEALLGAYTAATVKADLNRGHLASLDQVLAQQKGWTVVEVVSLLAPRLGPFSSAPLAQIFSLWIDIFERSKAVECDFDAIRAELDEWSERPDSYNQVGVKIIELRRD
jgi:2-polyprenyl-3-methyl-5-hydroxy-6-metoxy-1,4-benzoquinol methylase